MRMCIFEKNEVKLYFQTIQKLLIRCINIILVEMKKLTYFMLMTWKVPNMLPGRPHMNVSYLMTELGEADCCS